MLRTAGLGLMLLSVAAAGSLGDDRVGDRVQKLTRAAPWRLVASIPIAFPTFHPQGMVKIGDVFYVSSVDIKIPTKRFTEPQSGYDRDTGAGVGHLFKVDMNGNLLGDLTLGEGSIFHPGGIDYDGRHIWVPVAEYRPNSHAIIYRVDPQVMSAVEVFRFADHIGGIAHNTDDRTLHGVSWGSRRFYKWTLDGAGKATSAGAAARDQSCALHRLSGLPLFGRPPHAVLGLEQLQGGARWPDLPARRLRDRRLEDRPGDVPGADRAVVAVGVADDPEPVLGRGDQGGFTRLFHARRRHVDAVRL
jgi:hypothetical protein